MTDKIKGLLLWYYENQPNISLDDFNKYLTDNNLILNKDITKFFKIETTSVSLNKPYLIGQIEVKKTIAFFLREDDDLIVYAENLGDALNKDIVLLKVGKAKNAVAEVLKSALTKLIVTVKKFKNQVRFYSDTDYKRVINVPNIPNYLVDGHIVLLDVVSISSYNINCKFAKVIGHLNDPDIDIVKIIYEYDWPLTFSDEILDEVSKIKVDHEYEKNTRRDLSDELIVTIDGADAKDLDDAISIVKQDKNYLVKIHIADVSYFIKEGSLLDKEAFNRATSVYLADRVIPMLPHGISNDLCSLNPHQAKYCITCEVLLDSNCSYLSHQIYPSIISSKYRLTYTSVNEFINNNKSLGNKELDDMINLANQVSLELKQKRSRRGAIDFVSSELKFEIDKKTNKVLSVSERTTDYAEGLIESFMILANEVVATHFIDHGLSGIYRVHEKPDITKLENALLTAAKLGFVVKKDSNSHKTLQMLTQKSVNTKYEYVVHMSLLRAMQKAKYFQNPIGHYGLASQYYSHFTSPIRRYPDLLLHRMIRALIFNKPSTKTISHFKQIIPSYAKHSSDQERKAIGMERDVVKLKSCSYLEDKIGQIFSGTIVSLTNSGLFVKLFNGIEGFIALRDVNMYLMYDEIQLSYYTQNGKKYRLGDKIDVRLLNVNLADKQISFTFAKEIKGDKHENPLSKQKGQPRLSNRGKNRGRNKTKRK